LRFAVQVGPPHSITPTRRCIPILGGTVAGEYRGTILPGADWQTIAPDGTMDISARYTLSLEQGLVEIQSNGLRSGSPEVLARLAAGEVVDPADYYFRTAIRFFTAVPELLGLNHIMAIAVGERRAGEVLLDLYKVK
jgi:hypothetical protein